MKNIIEQLNKLKSLKPDPVWKNKNRDLLLYQIGGNEETKNFVWQKALLREIRLVPSFMLKKAGQPVIVTVLIVLFGLGGGALSIKASKDTKPGDSLYIAKRVSEKAQFALAFDEKDKSRLNIQFAHNRIEELNRVMEDENAKDRDKNAEKLVVDINKEITGAKTRLKKISSSREANGEPGIVKPEKDKITEEEDRIKAEEEEQFVFSANTQKDEKGLEISEPKKEDAPAQKDIAEPKTEPGSATSAKPLILETEPTVKEAAADFNNPQKILQEAKELLEKDDYEGALGKLSEADGAVAKIGTEKTSEEIKEIIAEIIEADLNKEAGAEEDGKDQEAKPTEEDDK